MGHEVAAALGRAGVDDELARDVIERAQHRHLLCLSRRRHAQVSAGLGPGAGEIGMRQRLALVAVEKNDVAGFGLTLAQLQAQADPIDLAGDLPSFQRVPGPPPAELFFRNALDNCDRLMRTPSRVSISARRRAIVQFGRSATGSSSKGVTTRNAASLFTGGGPGATLAFNASDTAAAEIAAPQPNRILAHAERLGDPRTGPARQRQQHGARPIRLAAITRPRKSRQGHTLFVARRNRRLSRHAAHLKSEQAANRQTTRWSTNRNLLRLASRDRRRRDLAHRASRGGVGRKARPSLRRCGAPAPPLSAAPGRVRAKSMMNLAEYRRRPQSLADFLPWAALVREGVILNKDGSFQRTAKFRGPDLNSSTPAELVAITSRLNNALRRLGTAGRSSSKPSASPPTLIRSMIFPNPPPSWSTRNVGPNSRKKARISRAGIS